MTERWQNELRKLRSVHAPEQLRARVDHGPSGDELPPTRQRVLAGVVAFAVFAGAGAFAWRALSPSARPPADVGGVDAQLFVNVGSPTADSKDVGVTAHYLGIEDTLDTMQYDLRASGLVALPLARPFPTALPAGTELVIHAEAPQLDVHIGPPPLTFDVGREDGADQVEIGAQPKSGEPVQLPAAPGWYLVDLSATWPETYMTFRSQLLIEIVPRDVPVVTFTRDGGLKLGVNSYPSGVLLWHGRATPLYLFGLDGDLGGGGATLVDFAPPDMEAAAVVDLPVGMRLVVAGDATTIEGTVRDPSFPDGPPGDPLPLRSGRFDPLNTLGRAVLTFSLGWAPGSRHLDTSAAFFLPVDVVPAQPTPVPTVEPTQDGVVVIANGTTTDDANDPVDVSIRLEVGGIEVEGAFGGSETTLTFSDGTGSASFGDPAPVEFRRSDFVAIPEEAPLTLQGNPAELTAAASAGQDPFEGTESFDASAGRLPELSVGRHVLSFDVTWELGPTPALQHATAQLTMYFPIEIVPAAPTPSSAEDVLRIDCAADPVVGTPVVAAGIKGVDVRSPDGGNLGFKNLDTGQFLGWGTDTPLPAPDPGDRAVLPFDPGTWVVLCGGTGTSAGEFRVVDPLHAFRSSTLACPVDEQVDLVHRTSAAPDVSSEEELIRLLLPGIRSSDVVELAGYPERADAYLYRVLREGSVIAAVQPDRDQVTGRGCSGTGVDLGAAGAA